MIWSGLDLGLGASRKALLQKRREPKGRKRRVRVSKIVEVKLNWPGYGMVDGVRY
jgi:hypothetical protein